MATITRSMSLATTPESARAARADSTAISRRLEPVLITCRFLIPVRLLIQLRISCNFVFKSRSKSAITTRSYASLVSTSDANASLLITSCPPQAPTKLRINSSLFLSNNDNIQQMNIPPIGLQRSQDFPLTEFSMATWGNVFETSDVASSETDISNLILFSIHLG